MDTDPFVQASGSMVEKENKILSDFLLWKAFMGQIKC